MKWKLHPENKKLTTTLPMSLEVHEWEGQPRIRIDNMGELKLKAHGKILKTDFYFTLPGEYRIEIRDEVNQHEMRVQVLEHQYLDFSREFGFFFILFLIVMGGIIIWTRKIMQKETPRT